MPQTSFAKMQSKSSLPMILVLLVLIAGFVFYFQIIRPGQVNEYEILPDVQREVIKFRTFKAMQLDFSVFERADFKNLRISLRVLIKLDGRFKNGF